MHCWVGYSETKRDLAQELSAVMTEFPRLKVILAHFGLGFDAETLPRIHALLKQHKNLYLDTSLYGAFCELWFTRASNRAAALRELVLAFPRQILWGTDVFGSRLKDAQEYKDAIRASALLLEFENLQCAEFTRTAYFEDGGTDKYGSKSFAPLDLKGLGLSSHPDILENILWKNAERLFA